MSYFFLFLSSFILGAVFLFILGKISLKFNLFEPKRKVPYAGGLAIAFSFVICYVLFNSGNLTIPPTFLWTLIFAFLLLVIEFVDDLRDFSLKSRLVIQIIFVFLFLLYGKKIQIYFFPSWLNYIFSFFWIMGITNAFNLIDIGDGLCAGVSLTASLSFLAVSLITGNPLLSSLFASLSGAIFIFLIFNLPPAKIFMGNSGCHFLGFLFAALSMYGDYATLDNPVSFIAPILILAFPIIDTTFVVFARMKRGMMPLKKSDDHIFLRLLATGVNIKKALFIIYFVSLLWGLSGIFIVFGFNPVFLITVILACLFTSKIIFELA